MGMNPGAHTPGLLAHLRLVDQPSPALSLGVGDRPHPEVSGEHPQSLRDFCPVSHSTLHLSWLGMRPRNRPLSHRTWTVPRSSMYSIVPSAPTGIGSGSSPIQIILTLAP